MIEKTAQECQHLRAKSHAIDQSGFSIQMLASKAHEISLTINTQISQQTIHFFEIGPSCW